MSADLAISRRVNGEGAVLLGAGRALLMQLAHPQVAAGVAEHSRFEADPLRRLVRTLRPTYAVAFGAPEVALGAGARVRATHDRVHGARYDAHDPELLLWVQATLIDTALEAYTRFVGPLSRTEQARYYLEMRMLGEHFGLPREQPPADLAAFECYVASMIASLEVTPAARRLVAVLLGARPYRLAPLTLVSRTLTSGLLPPRLRAGYGLHWTPAHARVLAGLEAASRAVVPRLPPALRRPPPFLLP